MYRHPKLAIVLSVIQIKTL